MQRGQKKKKGQEVGRALANVSSKKKAQRKRVGMTEKELHAAVRTTEHEEWQGDLKSVTEPSNLEDFMAVAQLKNEAFDSVKENTVVLESNAFVQVRAAPSVEQLAEQKELWDRMRVPRRPRWNREMNVDDLHEAEKEAFLEWRRTLSVVEEREHIMLTPFEKNINVWRQLWRVVELCDVLVQIVDARDPELFRCEDLERYVHEVGETKRCMLLLNKADLLTENQRRLWAEYYNQKGVRFHFFSAKTADEAAKDVRERERQMRGEKDVDELSAEYEEEEDDDEEQDELEDDDENDKVTEEPKKEEEAKKETTRNDWDVLSRDMLVEMFEKLAADVKKDGERLNVGFCGYPNVGKSSTINKLMEEKKVTVSATPGKTKHFQSLMLGERLCVLDSPGLVFPNFVTNKAAMICSGLLPIDQLREWRPAGSLICQRIKRTVLEAQYGIVLPEPETDTYGSDPNRPPTVDELFQAYAFVRGFMGVSGVPNMAPAARVILKDYVNGVLRYVASPPGFEDRFDCQEGQEIAVSRKINALKKAENRAQERKKATYVEPKATPEVAAIKLLPKGATEISRKKRDDNNKKLGRKKRGGKGKHKGEIEHPYGLPPDPIVYK